MTWRGLITEVWTFWSRVSSRVQEQNPIGGQRAEAPEAVTSHTSGRTKKKAVEGGRHRDAETSTPWSTTAVGGNPQSLVIRALLHTQKKGQTVLH